ncbi:MAG: hypothetical protein IV100_15695 [Myxococcales bacterium]|nr:hypothetical protein [Myxococcales bacterium]
MTWVLLWLASSALAVTLVGAHLGVGLTTMATRLRPWVGALGLALAWMIVEPLEGQNDGDDPTSLLPRLFKWAFFAGTLAGLRGPERLLAVPLLTLGQGAAIAFIVGPAERLVFDGTGIRAAWAADKTTALEGYVRSAFESVWGTSLDYPAGLVFDYLGVFVPWLLPAAATLLGAFAWALFRSVTAGQGAPVFPAFPRRALALVAPLAIPLWWLPGDGPPAVVVHDIARSVWLLHVVASVFTLRKCSVSGRFRRFGLDGAMLGTLLVLLPDVAGLVIGLAGSVHAALAITHVAHAVGRTLVSLSGPVAVLSAMASALILNEVDIEVRNPQAGARSATVGRAMAETPTRAREGCEAQNLTVCEVSHFRDVAGQDGARGTWTWVRIPSGRLGATTFGAATQVTGPDGGVSTLAVAAPYLIDVFGDASPPSLPVLCCPRRTGAPAR